MSSGDPKCSSSGLTVTLKESEAVQRYFPAAKTLGLLRIKEKIFQKLKHMTSPENQ